MPESFAEMPNGSVLIANGIDAVLVWDGFRDKATTAGVIAPTTALTMTGSGDGGIIGTYFAFTRFVDEYENFSDLSPVSVAYTTNGRTGAVTNATNATPIVITSTAHGLLTGTKVKITGVFGNTAANDTWSITVLSADTFSLDESVGNGTFTLAGTWIAGVSTVTYSNVPLPAETKVVRRQILRNTDGQATTFYIDVDTTDLGATTFSSTRIDTELTTQVSQALLDDNGDPLANRFGIPPRHKAVVAHHSNRAFLAAEVEYFRGNVQVTQGSATVTGIGTEWRSTLAGRQLYVNGGRKPYTISSLDQDAQTLTLSESYTEATDKFAAYAIRSAPAERRLVYYSEAGFPEAWPAINAFSVQEDGDEITGLMQKGSFIYILETRHIYRFTFQNDPATDGFVFLSANRGCINNRCWVLVEDIAYMLDEAGIHGFSGGQTSEQLSTPVQDIFQTGTGRYGINWKAQEFFHAAHYPSDETIRWFVALSGEYLPRHALCYDYRGRRWWIEEYPVPIGSSATGRLGGIERVFLGSRGKRTLVLAEGTLDGPDPSAGKVRGTITSAGLMSLTDSSATFPSSGLVGNPITITKGRGKGQRRIIASVSSTTITIDNPWLEVPDTTSTYQAGGIQWQYRTGWFRWAPGEQESPRRIEFAFSPLPNAATMDVRLFADRSQQPIEAGSTFSLDDGNGVESNTGEADLVVDLTRSIGFAQKRIDGHKEFYTDGWRYVQIELSGVSNRDKIKLYHIFIDGAIRG